MLFLLAEILNFQGSTHQYGVGSFSMKYITQISSYVMTLTTGKKIPVPKARYAQVKREYMLYKGEE